MWTRLAYCTVNERAKTIERYIINQIRGVNEKIYRNSDIYVKIKNTTQHVEIGNEFLIPNKTFYFYILLISTVHVTRAVLYLQDCRS